MWRCLGIELLSMGGGHVLAGSLRRGAGWLAAAVGCLFVAFWVPVAAWAFMAVRFSSIVEAARRGRHGPPAAGWAWKPALVFVAVSFGTLIAVRSQVLDPMKVPSAGMAPTLRVGDWLLADKL